MIDYIPLVLPLIAGSLILYMFLELLKHKKQCHKLKSEIWQQHCQRTQAENYLLDWQRLLHRHYTALGDLMHNAGSLNRNGHPLEPQVGLQIGDIGHYLRAIGNDPVSGQKRNKIHYLEKWDFNDPKIEPLLKTLPSSHLVELSVFMLAENRTLQECLRHPDAMQFHPSTVLPSVAS